MTLPSDPGAAVGNNLRILYVWDADYPWDVRTEKICATLTARGHEVHIVARNRARKPCQEGLPEGIVHRMEPWRWAGSRLDNALSFPAFCNPRWYSLIAGTLSSVRPHLVMVRDLPLCPTAIVASRRAGVPIILDMAENYPAMIRDIWLAGRNGPLDVVLRNPRMVEWVEDWCLPRLDGVIVVVDESAERLRVKGVAGDRITVVSNTPPRARAETARQPDSRPSGELLAVYLGIMEIPRGVGDLIDAVKVLRTKGIRIRARLIGGGRDLVHFKRQADLLGLGPEDLEFCGPVPSSEALKLIREADVGIVPHHATEAWNTTVPNKLFDYWAAGLPVITSDTRPCARLARETGGALVFQAGAAEDLASALEKLLDTELRDRLGAAGRRGVVECHNWEVDSHRLNAMVERTATPAD
jgi:glycosyltransferase involved in cell wall biosynthesis